MHWLFPLKTDDEKLIVGWFGFIDPTHLQLTLKKTGDIFLMNICDLKVYVTFVSIHRHWLLDKCGTVGNYKQHPEQTTSTNRQEAILIKCPSYTCFYARVPRDTIQTLHKGCQPAGGFEPRNFLLWHNSVYHCTTTPHESISNKYIHSMLTNFQKFASDPSIRKS